MTQEQVDALVEQAESVATTALVKRPDKDVIECESDTLPWALYRADQAKCAKYIKAQFKPIKDEAHARHKAICAKEAAKLAEYEEGEIVARRTLEAWKIAEDRRRAEAQALAEAQAREEAVAQALADGNAKLAKQIDSGTVAVSAPVVAAAPVKIAGMSFTIVKKGRVIDKSKFVRGCLSNAMGLNLDWLLIDEKRLNDLVKATGGAVDYPGVQVYEEQQSKGTGR
jgi:hypothetical protein